MNAEIEIFERYRSTGIVQGEELLLRHSDALRFIADCEQLGLMILGMNFYKQQDDDIIELLCPADYSSLSLEDNALEQSIAAARRLIEYQLPEDATWVSFTVEERTPKVR